MFKDKYFVKDVSEIAECEDTVYIGNKITGEWFKMPKICMDTINYSYENKIAVGDTIKFYEDENDKTYYKKILKNLKNIGLLSNNYMEKTSLKCLNKITFAITNRCNLKCPFCSMDAGSEKCEDLDYDTIINIIQNIMKFAPKKLVLTGGEPLIRKDFFDILKYIKKNYDTRIQLMTNATLINESNIELLTDNLYAIDISIDGYDKDSCDSVRGNGTFDKVNKSVKLLKMKNFKNISLSMVFGENNYNMLERFKGFCRNKGVKSAERSFYRMGRGQLDNIYLKDPKDVAFITDFDINFKLKGHTCGTGATQIYVDYNGEVYPCSLLNGNKYKMINALEIDDDFISKVLKKELDIYKKIDNLNTLNYHKCNNCKNKFFCNNCLAIMDKLVDNDDLFEHNCSNIKKIMSKIR